jgi:hypothetical protein
VQALARLFRSDGRTVRSLFGLANPLPQAEALHEAKAWLRGLTGAAAKSELTQIARGDFVPRPEPLPAAAHPFADPHDWPALSRSAILIDGKGA